MKIKTAVITLGTTLLMTSLSAQAELSANVAITTDYSFRGISQNDEAMAIQGGFDYAHENVSTRVFGPQMLMIVSSQARASNWTPMLDGVVMQVPSASMWGICATTILIAMLAIL